MVSGPLPVPFFHKSKVWGGQFHYSVGFVCKNTWRRNAVTMQGCDYIILNKLGLPLPCPILNGRQSTKFPNRISLTTWDIYWANSPEKINVPNAVCAIIRVIAETMPFEKAGKAFLPLASIYLLSKGLNRGNHVSKSQCQTWYDGLRN